MRRRKLSKIMGLSVLAVVAVMAMNASAAQATYKLNGGTESAGVLLLHLHLVFGLGEILISPLNVHVHCTGGTGLLHLITDSTMVTLNGSGTADFTGCTVVGFPKCTVNSPGAAAGLISAKGEGSASMSGTETFSNLKSANFSEFGFHGALCPFNEIEGTVNGEVKLGLQGETTAASHTGTLDDIPSKLFYGEEEAVLHGVNLTTPIAVTATKEGGGNWGIAL